MLFTPGQAIPTLLFVTLVGTVFVLQFGAWGSALTRRLLRLPAPPPPPRWVVVLGRVRRPLFWVGTVCILYGWLVEPRWVQVTHHEVAIRGADAATDPRLRIFHLSDLHCEAKRGPWAEAVVAAAREAAPDLAVLTGDYLNVVNVTPTAGSLPGIVDDLLRALPPSTPVLAVRGNFDIWGRALEVLRERGIRVLDNDVEALTLRGVPVDVAGLRVFDEAKPLALAARFRPGALTVFLHHMPDFLPEAAETGADLYLCGHTHGGQVRLPLYGALLTLSRYGKRFEMGEYRVGGTWAYVNRGLGLEPWPAPQVRFLCRPEVAIIDVLVKRP
ncbi:MAG: metallophosphoesterase [Planctomycetes bacterium]|nr:metallophosphoesterase [Planctomycetota bacterium]